MYSHHTAHAGPVFAEKLLLRFVGCVPLKIKRLHDEFGDLAVYLIEQPRRCGIKRIIQVKDPCFDSSKRVGMLDYVLIFCHRRI